MEAWITGSKAKLPVEAAARRRPMMRRAISPSCAYKAFKGPVTRVTKPMFLPDVDTALPHAKVCGALRGSGGAAAGPGCGERCLDRVFSNRAEFRSRTAQFAAVRRCCWTWNGARRKVVGLSASNLSLGGLRDRCRSETADPAWRRSPPIRHLSIRIHGAQPQLGRAAGLGSRCAIPDDPCGSRFGRGGESPYFPRESFGAGILVRVGAPACGQRLRRSGLIHRCDAEASRQSS